MKDCCKVGPKTKECVRKSDKKTFKFPFTTWEDRIYLNKRFKNEHSRTSS